jgi:hypothetical protein
MSERNVDSLEMSDDLERGRSKDLTLYDQDARPTPVTTLSQTGPKRTTAHKYMLLGVFCLGVFIDGQSRDRSIILQKANGSVLGVCVFYLLIAPVAQDLDIVFEQQTWVIVSPISTEPDHS